eukprot:g5382.t1
MGTTGSCDSGGVLACCEKKGAGKASEMQEYQPQNKKQMLKESVELHAPAVVKCDEAHRCTSPGPLALAVSVEDGMGWVVLRSEAKYAKLSIDVPAFGSEVFLFYRTRLLVRARHGAMKMWIMAYTFTQTRYTKSMFV